MRRKEVTKYLPFLLLGSIVSTANATKTIEPELWNGAYSGLSFGAGGGTSKGYTNIYNTTISKSVNNAGTMVALTENGTSYTGTSSTNSTLSLVQFFIGYNLHSLSSNLVYGAQLEASHNESSNVNVIQKNQGISWFINYLTPIQNKTAPLYSANTTGATFQTFVSIIGRAGVLVKPNTLLYGLAGPSEMRYSINSIIGWKLGAIAGAGLEYKFNNHWSALIEYRRMMYGTMNGITSYESDNPSLSGGQITYSNTKSYQAMGRDLKNNIGNFAVVYKF